MAIVVLGNIIKDAADELNYIKAMGWPDEDMNRWNSLYDFMREIMGLEKAPATPYRRATKPVWTTDLAGDFVCEPVGCEASAVIADPETPAELRDAIKTFLGVTDFPADSGAITIELGNGGKVVSIDGGREMANSNAVYGHIDFESGEYTAYGPDYDFHGVIEV